MQTVKIESFKVIGITVRTTNENGEAQTKIPELWNTFISKNMLQSIPNKVDDTIYSIYTAYEKDHTKPYTTMLGCKVTHLDTIPEGMTGISFDGGMYHKITAKGDLTQGVIIKHWSEIWNMNLDRAFTTDFEVYGERAQDPQNAEVDILVAIKE